jgi:hypothetical protein
MSDNKNNKIKKQKKEKEKDRGKDKDKEEQYDNKKKSLISRKKEEVKKSEIPSVEDTCELFNSKYNKIK